MSLTLRTARGHKTVAMVWRCGLGVEDHWHWPLPRSFTCNCAPCSYYHHGAMSLPLWSLLGCYVEVEKDQLYPHLTLGNFKILKIMNLASNCRYPLWFLLLCRKWVLLSWSLSYLNGQYYRDVLLSQQTLPVIKHVASDTFVFQQANVQRHH